MNGHLNNDSASDWIGEFLRTRRLSKIKNAIEKGLADVTGAWDEAVAAAEIVALLRGYPSDDQYPPHLYDWAVKKGMEPLPELTELGRKLMAHIIATSNTDEHKKKYKTPDHLEEYLAEKRDLLARLRRRPRSLEPSEDDEENEPNIANIFISTISGQSVKRKHSGRQNISALDESILIENEEGIYVYICVDLDQRFTDEDLETLAKFLNNNAQYHIRITRRGKRISNKQAKVFLDRIAPSLVSVEITIMDLDSSWLDNATKLSSLQIDFCGINRSLEFLKGKSNLEVLIIRELPKLPGGDLFSENVALKCLSLPVVSLVDSNFPELPPSLEWLRVGIRELASEIDLAGLTRLPNLKQLFLYASKPAPLPNGGFLSLECLEIFGNFTQFDFLLSAKNLLDLTPPPQLNDLSFVGNLLSLRRLNLRGISASESTVGPEDLTVIEGAVNLRTLHIYNNSNIAKLPFLPNLERFDFFNIPNIQASEITKFPKLKVIHAIRHLRSRLEEMLTIVPGLTVTEIVRPNEWREADPCKYDTYY